mgnify:CR=1 FL=1
MIDTFGHTITGKGGGHTVVCAEYSVNIIEDVLEIVITNLPEITVEIMEENFEIVIEVE